MIELTERLLSDAGGWQAMQEARSLYEGGRVLTAAYEPPLLQGRIRQGETELRSGLRIISKSNVENLCVCRDSKQRGLICAHSLAIGIAVLKPRQAPVVAVQSSPVLKTAPKDKPALPEIFSVEGEGLPAELFIILAPNFAAAWERNSITVGAEVSVGAAGRRILLNAIDRSKRFRCSPADLKAIKKLRELVGGDLPGMALFPRAQFLSLLGALAGHPKVTFGKNTAVKIAESGIQPKLMVERAKDGAARLWTEMPGNPELLLAPGADAWVLRGNEFVPVAKGLPAAYQDILLREVVIPANAATQFLSRELPALASFFEIDPATLPAAMPIPAAAPRGGSDGSVFILKIEGSLNFLAAELECRRGESRVSIGGAGYRSGDPLEQGAIERLRRCGFMGPDVRGQFVLKGEQGILMFFGRDLPRLEREWEVTVGSRFQHVTRDVTRIEPKLEVRTSSGQNWFELNVELSTPGGERFTSAEIQRLLQSGRSSVRMRDGKVAVFNPDLLDEFQHVLNDCNPTQKEPGKYQIGSQHAAYLEGVAAESGIPLESPAQWRTWATAPRQLDRLSAIPLGDLENVLRPYQKQGVYWLHFLAQNGWGGILADEMGLGKTVQMLAFLRTTKSRALVVCPSSLIFNWQREAARFAPELRTLAIQGAKRHELFGQIAEADVVITSYPLLRRDVDQYRGIEFGVMVLDEAQHIKNPESQNAQSAQAIEARNRFVLTGTPVENSVRDIWSIMNFLMPGYLRTRSDFKERFEQSIQSDPGGPEQRRLVQRLKPFILRRLKKGVAPELPDKIEQVAYCELSGAQQETYKKLLESTRRQVSELASTKDQNKARILMLTALLRLRQACCDLRLLGLPDVDEKEASAKLELLDELLQEALDGGHRVIVFSQFVSMLHLIRDQLTASETEFCYLDGSTKDRQAVVDRFQTGTVPVFLMSLKAGGVGLNLTAADTVIHFDPWWNPAVEMQATDRAHRIGQKNVVTAYKLIARGTVEEKILALQAKKRDIINATIESEQPMMDGLTTADIEALIM